MENDNPTLPVVYTHGGPFHSDEVVAIALLRQFFFDSQEVAVVRGRGEPLVRAVDDPETFVVDAGLCYDPARRNFDHHQDTRSREWDDGMPMSSCGLVWSWLRDTGRLAHLDDRVLEIVEQELIRPIDKHDNGLGRWALSPVFRMYNRTGGSPQEVDAGFTRALEVAADLVANQIHQATIDARAEAVMEQAWERMGPEERGIVIVHAQTENRTAHAILARISGYQANLMLYPSSPSRKNKHWFIRAMPQDEHLIDNRVSWPSQWRGKTQMPVEASDGRTVMIDFVHKSGFLGRITGQLEDAWAVAKTIMDHPENRPGMDTTAPASAPRTPRR